MIPVLGRPWQDTGKTVWASPFGEDAGVWVFQGCSWSVLLLGSLLLGTGLLPFPGVSCDLPTDLSSLTTSTGCIQERQEDHRTAETQRQRGVTKGHGTHPSRPLLIPFSTYSCDPHQPAWDPGSKPVSESRRTSPGNTRSQ